ncbi:MAG TPA: GNAT family N-acetyltransferase [Acidimicrobiales bacterium]|nr:GNAT family N-acetyltransferase [Acidimicrobiales bacterium]
MTSPHPFLTIREVGYDDPAAQRLVQALFDFYGDLHGRSGPVLAAPPHSPDCVAADGRPAATTATTATAAPETRPTPDPSHYRRPDGVFVVASLDGVDVGCGGVRRLEEAEDAGFEPGEQVAELKRMFVDPEHRGRGVAQGLIAGLEARAVDLGYTAMVLDTGQRQTAAVTLYLRSGYTRIPNWGRFAGNTYVVSFSKRLGGLPAAK